MLLENVSSSVIVLRFSLVKCPEERKEKVGERNVNVT